MINGYTSRSRRIDPAIPDSTTNASVFPCEAAVGAIPYLYVTSQSLPHDQFRLLLVPLFFIPPAANSPNSLTSSLLSSLSLSLFLSYSPFSFTSPPPSTSYRLSPPPSQFPRHCPPHRFLFLSPNHLQFTYPLCSSFLILTRQLLA
jgi:hypothetical protein